MVLLTWNIPTGAMIKPKNLAWVCHSTCATIPSPLLHSYLVSSYSEKPGYEDWYLLINAERCESWHLFPIPDPLGERGFSCSPLALMPSHPSAPSRQIQGKGWDSSGERSPWGAPPSRGAGERNRKSLVRISRKVLTCPRSPPFNVSWQGTPLAESMPRCYHPVG